MGLMASQFHILLPGERHQFGFRHRNFKKSGRSLMLPDNRCLTTIYVLIERMNPCHLESRFNVRRCESQRKMHESIGIS